MKIIWVLACGLGLVVGCAQPTLRTPIPGGYSGPVIDVHTHLFNVCDIPVRSIVLAQARQQSSVPVTEDMATVIADGANEVTRQTDGPSAGKRDAQEYAVKEIQLVTPATDWNQLAQFVQPPELRTKELAPAERTLEQKKELVIAALEKTGFMDRGDDYRAKGGVIPGQSNMAGGNTRVLSFLLSSKKSQANALMTREYPEVRLFVDHLLDFARTYNGEPLTASERQLQDAQALATNHPGRLVYFVPFDPFRGSAALANVRAALARGAVGVKFYPPNGYRPSRNQIPPRPSTDGWELAQWQSRYGHQSAAALDADCDTLFDYCEARQIPILTHCTPVGLQAATGYGQMSDPVYWRAVLQRHPELRVGFGHAGGDPWWFGGDHEPPYGNTDAAEQWRFAAEVVALCLQYPHVYCDMSYLKSILNERNLDAFGKRLAGVINRQQPGCGWRLGDKLMYGSDWLLFARERGYQGLVAQFQNVYCRPELTTWRSAFFAGNAIKYLGLRNLEREGLQSLTARQKEVLRGLVNDYDQQRR